MSYPGLSWILQVCPVHPSASKALQPAWTVQATWEATAQQPPQAQGYPMASLVAECERIQMHLFE